MVPSRSCETQVRNFEPALPAKGHSTTFRFQALTAALLLLGLLASCRTQLVPKPMLTPIYPVPAGAGADVTPGLEEILVIRHADPVQVQHHGTNTGFPLTLYRKRDRARAGTWVYCGAGGRAELLWISSGSHAVFFDEGVCLLAEPSRGEPLMYLYQVSKARLNLAPDDRVRLPGGSVLAGTTELTEAEYLLEHIRPEILRVTNFSDGPALIYFRDTEIVLASGERVDLPLLELGSLPFEPNANPVLMSSSGFTVSASEGLQAIPGGDGLAWRGVGSVQGLGVKVILDEAGEVVFDGLGSFDRPANFEEGSDAASTIPRDAPPNKIEEGDATLEELDLETNSSPDPGASENESSQP